MFGMPESFDAVVQGYLIHPSNDDELEFRELRQTGVRIRKLRESREAVAVELEQDVTLVPAESLGEFPADDELIVM